MRHNKVSRGFTLVELVTVVVLISIVGAVVSSRMMPSTTLQLQGGRDQLVSAFFVAQQKAMSQASSVRLTTAAGTVDIRVDADGNGSFASSESIRAGGVTYPLTLPGGISTNTATFDFDRLGRTTAATITLSKSGASVDVTVSGSGYAY